MFIAWGTAISVALFGRRALRFVCWRSFRLHASLRQTQSTPWQCPPHVSRRSRPYRRPSGCGALRRAATRAAKIRTRSTATARQVSLCTCSGPRTNMSRSPRWSVRRAENARTHRRSLTQKSRRTQNWTSTACLCGRPGCRKRGSSTVWTRRRCSCLSRARRRGTKTSTAKAPFFSLEAWAARRHLSDQTLDDVRNAAAALQKKILIDEDGIEGIQVYDLETEVGVAYRFKEGKQFTTVARSREQMANAEFQSGHAAELDAEAADETFDVPRATCLQSTGGQPGSL